jgi:hypothetical protein
MRTHTILQSTSLVAGLAVAALAAACTGSIGGDERGGDGANAGDPSAIPGGAGHLDPATACVGAPSPGAAPLRRLTQSQYNNTVRDLLGDTTRPADAFPPDETLGTFSNNAAALTVSPLLAQAYFTAAEALTTTALTHETTLLPCDPAAVGEPKCAQQFIETFGKRAFRRPLAPDEVTELLAIYTDNANGATFDDGLAAVIESILNSASFLYVEEYGVLSQNQNGVVPVGPFEMASRLSFFLWNSMPDDALFAAAEKGELATVEQIAAQARRMIADPKARDATREFYDQWLELRKVGGATKDPTTYSDFTEAARNSMLAETRAFLDYATWQGDGKVETLLTAPISFLDAETAPFYGLSVSGPGLQQTALDPAQRSGILTQPSILASQAKPNQSSPILRGKFVRERFLCQNLPPPPPGLVIVPPDVKPGVTTRERFAEHTSKPECAGCHSLMDPIGFGFEHYDGVGRYRTQDQGLPVDASGELTVTDVDGKFDGVPDLARKLAASQTVKDCIATQWYRYTMARSETDADKCSLAVTEKRFADANYDIRELLVGITTTDSFRYRPEVKP